MEFKERVCLFFKEKILPPLFREVNINNYIFDILPNVWCFVLKNPYSKYTKKYILNPYDEDDIEEIKSSFKQYIMSFIHAWCDFKSGHIFLNMEVYDLFEEESEELFNMFVETINKFYLKKVEEVESESQKELKSIIYDYLEIYKKPEFNFS